MKAVGDTIILKRFRMEKVTEGGIIIPQEKQRHDNAVFVGQILAMGPLALEKEMQMERDFGISCDHVNVGDYVVLARYSGTTIEFSDEEEYRLCLPGDVLAIISEEQAIAQTKYIPNRKKD